MAPENPGHLANGHLANGHLANGHLTNISTVVAAGYITYLIITSIAFSKFRRVQLGDNYSKISSYHADSKKNYFWLPIRQRIYFKVLLRDCKAANGIIPEWISVP